MIGKIQTNQIRELLEALSSGSPNTGRTVTDSDTDVSIQVNHASLINQAIQAPQADADVITAARELLRSGRLESRQNIQAAAENIVTFGI